MTVKGKEFYHRRLSRARHLHFCPLNKRRILSLVLCLAIHRENKNGVDAFRTASSCSSRVSPLSWSTLRIQQKLHAVPIDSAFSSPEVFVDYAPAAAALFNNMKTPASILSAGMVSLGFLAPFRLTDSIKQEPYLLRRIELLKRAYILVTLISFCSELLAVMWATVAVNQLTETVVAPSTSVWTLLERDFDLSWSATNSHFVLGTLG